MKIDKKKLELAMARACMSVNELAAVLGINRISLATCLNKKSNRPYSVGKIAKALGVDPVEIIEKDDE